MRGISYLLTAILFCFSLSVSGQIFKPVKWTMDKKQIANNEYELIFKAKIDDGWSVYSQYLESDDGPVKTTFEYEEAGKHFDLVGKNIETSSHKKEGHDELFDMNVIKFMKEVTFTQKVKVKDASKPIVGYLEFMTCDATRCLPPDAVDFEFTFAAAKEAPKKIEPVKTVPAPSVTPAKKEIETTNVENSVNKPSYPQKNVENSKVSPQIPIAPSSKPRVATETKSQKSASKIVEPSQANTGEDLTAGLGNGLSDSNNGEGEYSRSMGDAGQPKLLEPVKWDMSVKNLGAKEYVVTYTAKITEGWSIYSQYLESDDGPNKTAFVYEAPKDIELIGKNEEKSKYKVEGFDKMFDMNIVKYKKQVDFVQKFKLQEEVPVTGYLEFMTCDDTQCIFPSPTSFYFNPKTGESLLGAAADKYINGGGSSSATTEAIGAVVKDGKVDQKIATIQATYKTPLGNCGEEENAEGQTWFWTFIMGAVGGFIALLTPCVFPMIPLTVSFFTAGSKDRKTGIRNGLIYGASIIVIYVVIGLLFTALFGPEILNWLSTHWIPNTAFFLIFIFFAISFFGYFEITLPSSWTNKTDSMADQGGFIGTFFMAFTLALVSFSCTGPIIGTALVQATQTNQLGAFFVMLGFSSALALPFGLFAAFPAWLNSLPNSGGWMTSVKVVLGFIELALAFKFLSVADMTEHWGFLRYELFMGIWVILAIGLALYLFGFIRFAHDAPLKKVPIPRMILGIGAVGLVFYLASGFMYNEQTKAYNALPLLSGIAPPAHYNFFLEKQTVSGDIKERYPSFTKCANDLDCFKDYYEGMAYAKEINKPVLLDFTGHGCVNCRKTEEHIWVVPEVLSKIQDDYVLVSLYVDDRKKLDEVTVSAYSGKKFRKVGDKWTDFQIVNFDQNSQPLYVLMTPNQEVMAAPRGYKEGADDYAKFLDCGLKTFDKVKK